MCFICLSVFLHLFSCLFEILLVWFPVSFLKKGRKSIDFRGRKDGGSGRSWEREIHNQNTVYEKNLIKKKKVHNNLIKVDLYLNKKDNDPY